MRILSHIRFEQCENQRTPAVRLTFYNLCMYQVGVMKEQIMPKPTIPMFLCSHLIIKMKPHPSYRKITSVKLPFFLSRVVCVVDIYVQESVRTSKRHCAENPVIALVLRAPGNFSLGKLSVTFYL